ncbi:hypothetical protein HMI54_000998 [Coelomomyces lativittatus]|nr:hypothetical protein HMI56_002931 [Coelomomyces lativittatus]KAJ1511159.1 hypothetical protein HMI54_000998 [Coelomomyces lativittatus]KAJ1515466.1 hypothetical protein HMI55_003676 [Coelomomyces lativittatus]
MPLNIFTPYVILLVYFFAAVSHGRNWEHWTHSHLRDQVAKYPYGIVELLSNETHEEACQRFPKENEDETIVHCTFPRIGLVEQNPLIDVETIVSVNEIKYALSSHGNITAKKFAFCLPNRTQLHLLNPCNVFEDHVKKFKNFSMKVSKFEEFFVKKCEIMHSTETEETHSENVLTETKMRCFLDTIKKEVTQLNGIPNNHREELTTKVVKFMFKLKGYVQVLEEAFTKDVMNDDSMDMKYYLFHYFCLDLHFLTQELSKFTIPKEDECVDNKPFQCLNHSQTVL